MFNPLKYQYVATYLAEEGAQVLLKIRRGSLEEELHFPKTLLPPEVQLGDSFSLNLQPEESNKQGDAEVLRQLLSELIR